MKTVYTEIVEHEENDVPTEKIGEVRVYDDGTVRFLYKDGTVLLSIPLKYLILKSLNYMP